MLSSQAMTKSLWIQHWHDVNRACADGTLVCCDKDQLAAYTKIIETSIRVPKGDPIEINVSDTVYDKFSAGNVTWLSQTSDLA